MITPSAPRPAAARWMLSLLLASLLLWTACGDDSVSSRVITPPSVESPIENQQVNVDADPISVDLSSVFADDDSGFSYNASSSDAGVATAEVSDATLTVTPVNGGTAEITATASNQAGAANAMFTLQVNLPDPPDRP